MDELDPPRELARVLGVEAGLDELAVEAHRPDAIELGRVRVGDTLWSAAGPDMAAGLPLPTTVFGHGWWLQDDAKMSKSVGNVVAPEKVIKQYGAEILRLWVATQDYRNDTRVGDAILKQVSEAYRRIRNTARYILGNIHDFDPATDSVADHELCEIDRWALSRLEGLVNRVLQAYEAYDFHVLYHAVHNFCAVDMSAFYLDVLKDRLYTSAKQGPARRSAQTAMYRILDALTRMMAPVLSFTAEEIWGFLPGKREASAHLAEFPSFQASLVNAELEAKYDRLLAVRSDVAKVLELARAGKTIGHSLDARVELAAGGDLGALLASEAGQLALARSSRSSWLASVISSTVEERSHPCAPRTRRGAPMHRRHRRAEATTPSPAALRAPRVARRPFAGRLNRRTEPRGPCGSRGSSHPAERRDDRTPLPPL